MSTKAINRWLDATTLKQSRSKNPETRHTRKRHTQIISGLILTISVIASLLWIMPARGQITAMPLTCETFAYSTEEDFVTQGPLPPDGNPIISDGDLLGQYGLICARHRELVTPFDVNETIDLGLDAADVIDAESFWVAFSTELDSSNLGQFTAGDLLIVHNTATTVVPNSVLLGTFQIAYDIGLDGVTFVGEKQSITGFLSEIEGKGRNDWTNGELVELLVRHDVDIWFSTEGTASAPTGGALSFLDGDLLSAATGTIVAPNAALLPPIVPAGIPVRGVDFGLDAVTSQRSEELQAIRFSTEILYEGELAFTDGDVLEYGTGSIVYTNWDLIAGFEPKAQFLGLDAFHQAPVPQEPPDYMRYLPLTLKNWLGL
jgi:hypothetical protein